MKHYRIVLLGLFTISLSLLLGSCEKDEEIIERTEWVLSWSDEFDTPTEDGKPDPSKWVHETGATGNGNQELQNYTDRVENASYATYNNLGCLKITALEDNYEGITYSSARIKTEGLFEQKYGRFEARLMLPYGPGIWPAFWLLGANYATDEWPACGEIDIMENKGYQPNIVSSALHLPGHSAGNAITQTFGYEKQRFDTDFHVFAAEWDETKIDFFVDNVLYKRVKAVDVTDGEWVFDHPFFIILNVAVGGTFGGNPTEDTVFPQSMYVDYVRVYRKSTSPEQPGAAGGDVSSNGTIGSWDFNGADSDKGLLEPDLN